MSFGLAHDHHTREILAAVEAGQGISQRSLAKRLGIALGLTNLLLKRMVRRGWVRMIHVKPNRFAYLITPAGVVEKARMTRAYLAYSTRFYIAARDRIRERFAALSGDWPARTQLPYDEKRIAFYGAGDVAEIGYVCLQETDLKLVAVADPGPKTFLGLKVLPPAALAAASAELKYGRIVVMSFDDVGSILGQLEDAGIAADIVFWL